MKHGEKRTYVARHRIALLYSTLLVMAPTVAHAQTVTAAWDPSPATDQVTNYQVCVGTTSLSCDVALASVGGSTTTYAFTPTGGVLHYTAVRALNPSGTGPYSAEVSFSIPSFTQPLNQSSPTGSAIATLSLSVADPDGDTLEFTHTGLPPGLTLNSSTGRITGTPSSAGTYNVTVFVNDGLVTVSRSWVWTITSTQADTQAPTLTVTSHTSGQTVTTANVTISGTATDSNRGGRGITNVAVNGVTTGATATGSNTANWSRALTLTSGANTITVEATDGAGNVSLQQLTLTASLDPGAVTGATLTPNVASPEDVGASITFTATGSGGVAPRQFKFLLAQGGSAAQTVQNWSTTSSYTWTPTTAGSYTVSVWVRSAGVTIDAAQASAQVPYTIDTLPVAPVTGATLTPNVASPQNTGTPITFTATGSGGVAPRQFKFLVAQGGGAAQTVQNWSTSSTFTWTPTTAASYAVSVWARSAGVTTDVAQASTQVPYTISTPPPSPVTSATLTSSLASPQGTGTAITFWAGGSGGVGPRQYKFLLQSSGGSVQTVQDWSTATSYVWTPAATGNYTVTVWARSAGVTTDVAQAYEQMAYAVIAAGVNAVSATPSSGSGGSQVFTLRYSDSRGAANLVSEWFWLSGGAGACLAYHERATNRLYLLNDAGTAWRSQVLGSNTALQNSSCSIAVAGSSVSVSGPDLTLNLPVTFTSAFSGPKTLKMFANANGQLSSGWRDRGTWTVSTTSPTPTPTPTPTAAPLPTIPRGAGALDVTPSTGSGASQVFTLRYSDDRGATYLSTEWVWFSGGTGACLVYHERSTNRIYLLNDAGSAWMSRTLGSGGTLQNSSCAVAISNSSVSTSGQVLSLNLALSFTTAFNGLKAVRMFANANGGLASGWHDRGAWTVSTSSTPTPAPPPAAPPPPTIQRGVHAVSVTPGSGSGSAKTFVLQYTDSRGATNLVSEWIWFSGGPGACLVYHRRATNRVYLLNDAGTGWTSQTLGSGSTLQNNSCAIALGGSSVSVSGPVLTLNLAISFKTPFRGTKNVLMFANANNELSSGWQTRGTWIVP